MMNYWNSGYGHMGAWGPSLFTFGTFSIGTLLLLALVAWSIVWKALALWQAARDGRLYWFIALLLTNTAGILDILYLYVFRQKGQHSHTPRTEPITEEVKKSEKETE